MKKTGAILGWKFNHAPGICTVDGVITGWPEALGPLPTPEQLTTWEAEYATYQQTLADAATADAAAKTEAQADNVIQQLQGIKTVVQCQTFTRNNFPTLSLAEQNLMGKVFFAVAVLAKQGIR